MLDWVKSEVHTFSASKSETIPGLIIPLVFLLKVLSVLLALNVGSYFVHIVGGNLLAVNH